MLAPPGGIRYTGLKCMRDGASRQNQTWGASNGEEIRGRPARRCLTAACGRQRPARNADPHPRIQHGRPEPRGRARDRPASQRATVHGAATTPGATCRALDAAGDPHGNLGAEQSRHRDAASRDSQVYHSAGYPEPERTPSHPPARARAPRGRHEYACRATVHHASCPARATSLPAQRAHGEFGDRGALRVRQARSDHDRHPGRGDVRLHRRGVLLPEGAGASLARREFRSVAVRGDHQMGRRGMIPRRPHYIVRSGCLPPVGPSGNLPVQCW